VEYIIAVVLSIVAAVPGIYAVYRQVKKDSGDRQALLEQLRNEQQENLAEYSLPLESQFGSRPKPLLISRPAK